LDANFLMNRFMLSGAASISPIYLISPVRPASAMATALRRFAASIPTNASSSLPLSVLA
jgi:hypothetical protein